MASIAAGEAVAAVDANVIRVLSRLRCLAGDSKSKAAGVLHARLGNTLLDPERPGDFNQVMLCAAGAQPTALDSINTAALSSSR